MEQEYCFYTDDGEWYWYYRDWDPRGKWVDPNSPEKHGPFGTILEALADADLI